jgi:2-dehydro-3-deoxyphosphooctonate aldolase (KDO 8-P synthase)
MTKPLSEVSVGSVRISNVRPFTLIAGPCVMESRAHLRLVARSLKTICSDLKIPLIFKCSFDKANRSSSSSYRGAGLKDGLEMLREVKQEFGLPILTDVHLPEQAEPAAAVADVLQIPAFLCRQTDLVLACARTGRPVNVKKGQFLSPWDMKNAVDKILASGHRNVMLTERGSSFGYNNLVVDMRGLEVMKGFGVPVIFDATHSVQIPGGKGTASGGDRRFVLPLSKAALAVGVAGLFLEVHPDPDRALSDGPNSLKLSGLKEILKKLIAVDRVAKKS